MSARGRNIAGVKALLSLGTLVPNAMGISVGALADPLIEGLGSALETAAAAGIEGGIHLAKLAAVGSLGVLGNFLGQGEVRKMGSFPNVRLKGGKSHRIKGSPLYKHRNMRALLYHLGLGERSADELAAAGGSEEGELARLELKRRFGGPTDLDLCSRTQRSRGMFHKGDWLTEDERRAYTQLKEGKITAAEIDPKVLLPILWQANKIFDYHAKYMR